MIILCRQILLSLLLVLFYLLSTTHASEFLKGADTPINRVKTPTRDSCYVYEAYIVMFPYLDPSQLESAEDSWIVVRKRNDDKDTKCSLPKEGKELLTIRTGSFTGLYRYFVFTDTGTGPDGRSIEIYDLKKRKMVYEATYSPVAKPNIVKNSLIYYKDLHDLRYKEFRHCPDAEKWLHENGLDYGFEQKTQVNLDTLKEKPVGKITCSERQ